MERQQRLLRWGWTTGTCAPAAKAAFAVLVGGEFPDSVEVTLASRARPSFAPAMTRRAADSASAGVVKDAGDDPDVTHGALVVATVRLGKPGARAAKATAERIVAGRDVAIEIAVFDRDNVLVGRAGFHS